MKKLTTLAAAALALAMTGAGALAETTIQLGTTVNEQDSFQVAAEKFAELVEERTNGEYKIEIYPNGTLGGESDMLDSMSTGMLDMGIITSGPFVNFSEAMGVLDMPYLRLTRCSTAKSAVSCWILWRTRASRVLPTPSAASAT